MDYLPTAITDQHSDNHIDSAWHEIYGSCHRPSAWLGLNLQWPKFDLPKGRGLYIISWHTEYMDVAWLQDQCQKVYPSKVVNITDWSCDMSLFGLDNLSCLTFDTLGKQLTVLQNKFGTASKIRKPLFKISSLSMRHSQFKKYVTAYLINEAKHDDMILSWHNWVAKSDDLHVFPPGFSHLDLDYSRLEDKILINLADESDIININPVANGDWKIRALNDALINLTNESWHYSFTMHFGKEWIYPGPYLTEKTMKPLLAGRPFLAIGQYNTYQRLQTLGFQTDFGFDGEFDQDPGDLTRMAKIFQQINGILTTSLDDLFEQSLRSCLHNLEWIRSGDLMINSEMINQPTISALIQL